MRAAKKLTGRHKKAEAAMTDERLAQIKARLAKPVPEPYAGLLTELVEAVEANRAKASAKRGKSETKVERHEAEPDAE